MRGNERKIALLYDRFTTAILDPDMLRSDSRHYAKFVSRHS